MKKIFLMAIIFLVSCGGIADSRTEILQDKVDRMEAELTLIQRKLYKTPDFPEITASKIETKNMPENIDEFYSQIDAQNQVIQNLTQRVEQLEFELSTLNNRLDKINTDIDFRLSELGNLASKEQTSDAKIKDDLDKGIYDKAYSLLKKGEYEEAEQAFLKFMKDYPDSSLLGNANYWLGESYYARGQYAEAAGLFADGFTKYKGNTKAPDSMLKLGLTMKQLGKKVEACSAFNGLENEFPKANDALKNRAKEEAKALKCTS